MIDSELVPRDVQLALQNYLASNLQKNERLTGELIRILQALRAAGIAAIPFKGPVVSILAYGDLGLRRFADLDLLVPSEDVAKAKQILLSNAYQPDSRYQLRWEWHFRNIETGTCIDLHDRITLPELPDLRNYAALWRRLQPLLACGQEVESFSPMDTLLMLCMQISKDWHEKRKFLPKICDLCTLIERHEDIDWPAFLRFAQDQGLKRTVLVALYLTQRFQGVRMPDCVRAESEGDALIASLKVPVEQRMLTTPKRPLKQLEQIRSQMSFYESIWGKLWRPFAKYLIWKAFTPNEADEAFVKLPPSLSFLYYVMRPARLAGKTLVTSLRQVKVR